MHTLPPEMVNARPVRILLECILVLNKKSEKDESDTEQQMFWPVLVM